MDETSKGKRKKFVTLFPKINNKRNLENPVAGTEKYGYKDIKVEKDK